MSLHSRIQSLQKMKQPLVLPKKEKEGAGFKAIEQQNFPFPLFPPAYVLGGCSQS